MGGNEKINYRKDIDGIRAIAVVSVIIFHLGFLPNGYLGVDVFFVISGFLITKIVYQEALENHFSIIDFYLRRLRRIIPLVLISAIVSLLIGVLVMLPDDLENLAQSVFATNFFSNNILLLITSRDYWNIANEYKPLMHTWSLGVEEQFYIIYPILFLILKGDKRKYILAVLIILSIISISLYLFLKDDNAKFYLIQYRFFELSFGGLAAIIFKDKKFKTIYSFFITLGIVFILITNFSFLNDIKLVLIVVLSATLLVLGTNGSKINAWFLENTVMVWLGKISFSLYMWHQIILAYTRYFIVEKINIPTAIVIFMVVLIVSFISYFIIEQPFRNKKNVSTKKLLIVTGILFVFSTATAFYIYSVGGIIRNVPELNVYTSKRELNQDLKWTVNTEYNSNIHSYNRKFLNNGKTKIFIVGNSFARDFANVLLESKIGKDIDLSYVSSRYICPDFQERISQANYVLFSELKIKELKLYIDNYKLDTTKVWNIGTKNFGYNNGIIYNKKRDTNYCKQRTEMRAGFFEKNDSLQKEWKSKYINLIQLVIDKDKKMPIFSPNCKFISQDCEHLTQDGAQYFAKLLNIDKIIKVNQTKSISDRDK